MKPFKTLCILGRQPALGLAELESVFSGDNVQPCGDTAALIRADLPRETLRRLGGSIKMASIIAILDTASWQKVATYLQEDMPFAVDFNGEGKLQLGISSYGFTMSPPKLLATGLQVKKALKRATGRSVRLVSSQQELHLSSPQVIHNDLDRSGYEILAVKYGSSTVIARTIAEQDIEAYTRRDQERPKRDAKVGMLPPKLAQIIINLAVNSTNPTSGVTVLDPFCGTGVVLQEAALMGFGVSGSDLEPRMISYTDRNLSWLKETFGVDARVQSLSQGDATAFTWSPAPDIVACETYLGRPFTAQPSPEILTQTMSEVNLILKKFLRNIQPQLNPGTRLCIAVPAWQTTPNIFRHLPLIDQISDLGYNRVSFEHVLDKQLLYYREDQVTARELLVLTRK